MAESALPLPLDELQDSVDTLLLGALDEAAGIDDGNVALRTLSIVLTTIAASANFRISFSVSTRFLEHPIVLKSITFFFILP